MFYESEIIIPRTEGVKVFDQTGLKPGPSLAVVGRVDAMENLADRLSSVPSLAYMHGSMTIYAVDDDAAACQVPDVDDVLYLLDGAELSTARPYSALYWKVLARAAALGIIAGRGVPTGQTRVTWH